ncbi:LysR family transcriptional regulator [Thalassomonas actiniarum]|uniref:LysR family transcriptional regulator n=1 Tax=Thalassomonas actiniarum TaxID=485447 RepID=A0AAE9YVJ1_9GAMM|nr:LysR family transcriptional regulator [Thalassomonas actiniarum]WDE01941.1 LysR family transcriptional regulator [Thalassomonas actiniarum]
MFRAKSTLEQWRILQSVVDYGGYAKAAEKLNKSQSSLNHAVAKLQNQLGITLLEVKGRKAYLTSAGETMLRRSRQIMQDIEALESLAQTLDKGWEPEIILAVEILYPKNHLYQILNDFLPQSRGSRLKIREEVISGSVEAVKTKSADIVITNIVPQGYLPNTLCNVSMIAVCASDNLAIAQTPVKQEELASNLQIVISETGVTKNELGWLKAEQRWTVSNFHEAVAILKTGIGFCWLPTAMATPLLASGELRKITITDHHHREVPMHLVLPDRDSAGPGTLLLEQLFYRHHGLFSESE